MTSGREARMPDSARVDGFNIFQKYTWPDRCACCFEGAADSTKFEVELDVQKIVRTGMVGDHAQVIQLAQAAAASAGNINVVMDPNNQNKGVLEVRVPYCKKCKLHDRLGFASIIIGCGCALPVLLVTVIGIAGVAVFGGWSELRPEPGFAGRVAPFAAVWLALALGAIALTRIAGKLRKPSCSGGAWTLTRTAAVEFAPTGMGWVRFGNRDYAAAFASANGLSLGPAPGGQHEAGSD
jgi:hypothetical protein